MPKANNICKSQGHDWQPSLIPGYQRCGRCPAARPEPSAQEPSSSVHTEPEPALAVQKYVPHVLSNDPATEHQVVEDEMEEEPYTHSGKTRYEECREGSEERKARDWLFAWGRDHGFPILRYPHYGGVPRMTYYPDIPSGEPCWRGFCHNQRDDVIFAGVEYCEEQSKLPVSEERLLRDQFYNFGRDQGFPVIRFQAEHIIIPSGERNWRWLREEWPVERIRVSIEHFEKQDQED
jgi:hypothetical protein